MPLRLKTGITLKPQKPAPPVVHDIAAGGGGDPSVLDVVTGPQDALVPVSLTVEAVLRKGHFGVGQPAWRWSWLITISRNRSATS